MSEEGAFSLSSYLQRVLAALWHFWASDLPLILFLPMLIVTLLLLLLLPQIPSGVQVGSAIYGQWFAETRARYGYNLSLLQSLGLLNLRRSFLFRFLLSGFGVALVVRLAEELPGRVARMAERETMTVELAGDRLGPSAQDIWQPLRARLTQERIMLIGDWEPTWRQAMLRRWATLRPLVAIVPHVAVLGLLIGLFMNARWGWQENLRLAPGQSAVVTRRPVMRLVNRGIDAATEEPAIWTPVELGVEREGTLVKIIGLRYLQPSFYRPSLWILQTGLGPAYRIQARDQAGQAVPLRVPSEPAGDERALLHFEESGDEGFVAVPGQNLALRITYYQTLPERDLDGPTVRVEAFRSGKMTPVLTDFFQARGSWVVDGVTYSLQQARYARLRVVFSPGWFLVLASLAVLLLAVILLYWLPLPRAFVFASLSEAGTRCLRFTVISGDSKDGENLKQQLRAIVESMTSKI